MSALVGTGTRLRRAVPFNGLPPVFRETDTNQREGLDFSADGR